MKGPTNSSARPNIRLLNVSATFESNPDTSTNTEFPYRASIQADGVSEYMSATVMFSQIQATSGNFATYCQTDEDVVYIYSKTDVGTITIPAVSCDLSVNYINVDNVPTEDSQSVITSGGVYDALGDYVTKGTAQTITGAKTFTGEKTLSTASFSQSNLILHMKNNDTTNVTPSADRFSVIRFDDNSNTEQARIDFMHLVSGIKRIRMRINPQSGSTGEINLYASADGNSKYVTAPSRTYNSANTNDVVTIGSLASNPNVVHTTGNEVMNGTLKVKSMTFDTKNGGSGETYCVLDNDNTTIDRRARLVLGVLSNGNVQLYLEKYELSTGTRLAQQVILTL